MRKSLSGKVVTVTLIAFLLLGLYPVDGAKARNNSSKTKKLMPAAVAAPKIVKIGLIAPLTGEVAVFGDSSKNAFNLAMEQVNKKAGAYSIQTVIADDQNNPEIAVIKAQQLIEKDKVQLIVGSITSKCTIPISEVTNSRHIPQIACTATNPRVTIDNDIRKPYVFRTCFIDPYQGHVAASFALNSLKAKKAAVLFDADNEYNTQMSEAFKQSFEHGGGIVEVFEGYTAEKSDYKETLKKIEGKNVDVLFLPDYYSKVSEIGKQAINLGLKCTFLGSDGWDSPELDFESMEGAYFINHYAIDDPNPKNQSFVKLYKKRYGVDPDALAALSFDTANLAIHAVKAANSNDPVNIKNSLQAIRNFPSVSGALTIDANGNPQRPGCVLQIKNGKPVYVTSLSPAVNMPVMTTQPKEQDLTQNNQPSQSQMNEQVVGGVTLVPYTNLDLGIKMLAPKGWVAMPFSKEGEAGVLMVSNNDDKVFLTVLASQGTYEVIRKAGGLEEGFKVLTKLAGMAYKNLKVLDIQMITVNNTKALESTETFEQNEQSFKSIELFFVTNHLVFNSIYKADSKVFDKYREPLVKCIESLQVLPSTSDKSSDT